MSLQKVDKTWTRGTHIAFRNLGLIGKGGVTNHYEVITADGTFKLGDIKWFGRWRKYAFNPEPHSVYEQVCLREIAEFIETESKNHRERRKQEKAA